MHERGRQTALLAYVSPLNNPDTDHASGLDQLSVSRAHIADSVETLADLCLAAEVAIHNRASPPVSFSPIG
ncbi:MAG: hypothetical protein QOG19_1229 [Mycobacterium sp.]|nr:hypothetical protein [Mycobacterium sp.]